MKENSRWKRKKRVAKKQDEKKVTSRRWIDESGFVWRKWRQKLDDERQHRNWSPELLPSSILATLREYPICNCNLWLQLAEIAFIVAFNNDCVTEELPDRRREGRTDVGTGALLLCRRMGVMSNERSRVD